MRGRELLLDAQQVEPRRRRRRGAERLAVDLAAERIHLEVIEARRALDIGERLGRLHLQPPEHRARRERPFELPDELLEVVLHHAVQIDELAVDVVQHLHLARRLGEEHGGGAGERLDIAAVLREKAQQSIGEPTFASHPRNDRTEHLVSPALVGSPLVGSRP